ncbi:MAG: transcriptional regulator FtsR [Actinomycetes bacterium]
MSAALPARAGTAVLSIGEVLAALRSDFPDVTISKIRFLEAEGLIEPQRAPSGYRKFSRQHVERLRFVLTAQRDSYLPLRVIKEHLDEVDRAIAAGQTPPELPGVPLRSARLVPDSPNAAGDGDAPSPGHGHGHGHGVGGPSGRTSGAAGAGAADQATRPDERLSRRELIERSGLTEDALVELEDYGLLQPRRGSTPYDGDALTIATVARELAALGFQPRHLRGFKAAADREVGLVEQLIAPLLASGSPESRARAQETVREIGALSGRLHAALVRSALRSAGRA